MSLSSLFVFWKSKNYISPSSFFISSLQPYNHFLSSILFSLFSIQTQQQQHRFSISFPLHLQFWFHFTAISFPTQQRFRLSFCFISIFDVKFSDLSFCCTVRGIFRLVSFFIFIFVFLIFTFVSFFRQICFFVFHIWFCSML